MDVEGALSSGAIDGDDIALGLWDNAADRRSGVDWAKSRPAAAAPGLDRRGVAPRRDRLQGRAARPRPRARPGARAHLSAPLRLKQLGDTRCGINPATAGYSGTGTVTAVDDDRVIRASGLAVSDAGWFGQGVLTWTSGPNAGACEVRAHSLDRGTARLTLWRRAALPIAVGDTFPVVAGCDRTFADLPRQVRQHRQLPRLPAHAGQRLRSRRRAGGRERRRELLQ